MINTERKQQVMSDVRLHDQDTGSIEVQVALLTTEINGLMNHFKQHKHDYSGKRGLLKKVTRRRKFLDYIKKRDHETYQRLIAQLGLRK